MRQIARDTSRTPSTIQWHVKRIHRKLGTARHAELIRLVPTGHAADENA